MGWLLQILILSNFTGIKLFKLFTIGAVHPESYVRGILFGIWRFQFQFILTYDSKIELEGEKGYA
tara:strand:+ start:1344 stop:1538 length:195 start_codon:yes stop_codon:yes gene_type:complete